MFASLRSRLFLTYLAVILATLTVAALALAIFLIGNPLFYRQWYAQQGIALQIMQRRLASRPPEQWQTALKRESDRLAEVLDARVLVLARDGKVHYDTAHGAHPLPLPPLEGILPQRGHVRDAEGHTWVYSARMMPGNVWVVVAHRLPSRLRLLLFTAREWLLPLTEAGLLAILMALVLAWWLSQWVVHPLRHTAEAARALAKGQYQPVPEKGPRETRVLARAFNDMARRVEASQRSQREFVANVSHELKTPLTSIQGFAQAIIDGTARSPEAARKAAEVITAEAARMHRLVVTLLDLARLDAGTADLQREPLDLAVLLQSVLTRFQPQAQQAQIHLALESEGDLTLRGDADRLAQVFTNLLDNALKHTPPGGEVRLQASRTASGIEVRVEDTGSGIPPEVLPHIFERFYRGDKARSGGENAGLGLAIAGEIVRAHGGDITAHSIPGKGSVFVVKLRP